MRLIKRAWLGGIAAAVTLAFVSSALAADISGAGATFPYPVYSKWADAYKKETGIGLNYQSIGSGGGIKQIEARTVTFGASDAPLKPDDLAKNGLVQWPQIIGGVVPVANLKGIKPGELRIDGPALAKIYLGEITRWNDPVLARLNPQVKLPDMPILVVHRSDGSGTTFNFSNYLSAVSPEWNDKVGTGTALEWPVGVGAKGNEAVASMTIQTNGGIGYVEYAYVVQNHMTYMRMINKDGHTVAPTAESFQAAAANADWKNAPGYYLILGNQPGKASWPIAAASFILVHRQVGDAVAVHQALKFFDWSFRKGQKMAEALDYVPMPANVVKLIETTTWSQEIKDKAGNPVWK
ncbi:MAG: phosphate ABC transporter substrate-binding protein PstS [Gammaproteobacteria bacterium]|nr:phosphate ABC transporter substrate-binding protein PstS [Gammaproteobacteria bacterium]